MKRLHSLLAISLVTALLLLPACYENSNTGPENYNNSQNLINADIKGDFELDFTSKSMTFSRKETFSRFSATMIVNPFEIYSLEISFPDSVEHYSFRLSNTDTLTNFKVFFGHLVKEYYFRNIDGMIDFEKRTQDTMIGKFSFFAKDSLLKKSITVKDGSFKFIKNKKA